MKVMFVDESRTLSRLLWGLFLIGLGVLFLLQYLGVLEWMNVRAWWPFLVIALGTGQAVTGWSAKRISSGVSLALIGVWFLIAANGWHRLTWGNSWPLALVASGLGMVLRAILAPLDRGRVRPSRGGDVHVIE
ncbi:MAG TPA: DUF5668 domain-containing protein [Candidatus Acidoferrales bacterium]|nr:DUF5668 domain-containing protein [Candidatus Acidoferrales bacterium]